MRRDLSSFRILSLVIASVLMSALVTLIVYSTVAPRVFTQAKVKELLPRGQFIAEQASTHFAIGMPAETAYLLGIDSRQWDAFVWLFDENSQLVASTETSLGNPYYKGNTASFNVMLKRVFSGEAADYIEQLPGFDDSKQVIDLLFIGIPVLVEGVVKGAVIMLKPQAEIIAGMSSMTNTLWLSVLTVLCAMLPIAFWLARLTTKPIRQIRQVALKIAAGDYSVRANVRSRGEIGDLARAFNLLTDELGKTIGDLTRERNQAVTVINTLDEGILTVDADCAPMQTNPALLRMLPSTNGDEPSLSLPEEVLDEFKAVLVEHEPSDIRFPLDKRMLHLVITPIGDARAGVVSAIGVFHDETQAQQLEQTRREYVANVSHELRTPLTALRALIEPLRDGLIRTDEQRTQTYDIILRETMRLSRLVDDMLELSRLQSGSLALEKIRFRIEPLLNDTASIYAAKAAKTGHQLSLDIISPPLPTVMRNPDRTEQVLVGLLNNAFTHTPSGSHIMLRAEAKEAFILVTVEDDGPGIPEEALHHVFERFYKADKSHGGNSGTGLGLAIAMELMNRLGEEIYVENRAEGGASFSFTLHYNSLHHNSP